MNKYNITKDLRSVLIDINTCKRGQFYEKIYVITEGNKLTSLNLTDHLPGGEDDFINQWYKTTK